MTAPSSLLTQLRNSRFGWWLCALVLLLKMLCATVCLVDGSRAVTASTLAVAAIADVAVAVDDSGDGCVLGEGSGCHCACAHTVPMAFVVADHALHLDGPFDVAPSSPGFIAPFMGSLLRPPIA